MQDQPSASFYRLACGQDPRVLGIEASDGAWWMERFERHVQSCPICRRTVAAFRATLEEILKTPANRTRARRLRQGRKMHSAPKVAQEAKAVRLRYQVYHCPEHGIVAAQRTQAAAWDDPEWAYRIQGSTPPQAVCCPHCGQDCHGQAETMPVFQAGWFPDPEELLLGLEALEEGYQVFREAHRHPPLGGEKP